MIAMAAPIVKENHMILENMKRVCLAWHSTNSYRDASNLGQWEESILAMAAPIAKEMQVIKANRKRVCFPWQHQQRQRCKQFGPIGREYASHGIAQQRRGTLIICANSQREQKDLLQQRKRCKRFGPIGREYAWHGFSLAEQQAGWSCNELKA